MSGCQSTSSSRSIVFLSTLVLNSWKNLTGLAVSSKEAYLGEVWYHVYDKHMIKIITILAFALADIHADLPHTHARKHTCKGTHTHTHTHTHTQTHTHTNTHTQARCQVCSEQIWTRNIKILANLLAPLHKLCMYVCVHVCMSVRACVRVRVCVRVCVNRLVWCQVRGEESRTSSDIVEQDLLRHYQGQGLLLQTSCPSRKCFLFAIRNLKLQHTDPCPDLLGF